MSDGPVTLNRYMTATASDGQAGGATAEQQADEQRWTIRWTRGERTADNRWTSDYDSSRQISDGRAADQQKEEQADE